MARETAVRRGPVAPAIGGIALAEGQSRMVGDEFVFHAARGLVFRYRRGEGVTLDCAAEVDPRDVDLWFNGTIYAAVATMNGLFPVHASAVAHEGRVHAFTGPAGAGKSTLVAALDSRGFAHFCDDTLLLDIAGDGAPLCLPGHKRLKLWPEGAALAGLPCGELVAGDYAKHFVAPGAIADDPLPLAEVVVLEAGAEPGFAPLSASQRIELLDDDHNTAVLWRAAQRHDPAARFAYLAQLSRRMTMFRFTRSFDKARFAEGVECAAEHIRSLSA